MDADLREDPVVPFQEDASPNILNTGQLLQTKVNVFIFMDRVSNWEFDHPLVKYLFLLGHILLLEKN